MSKIYVIHENAAWYVPLDDALDARGVPHEELFFDTGQFAVDSPPPAGVFYNRMSASSHTRGHRYAAELATNFIVVLERFGRRVVNGSRAIALEMSKIRQYAALSEAGIRTPRTVAAVGIDQLIAAAQRFDAPFIVKHNRSGKGLGVERIASHEMLGAYCGNAAYEPPIDGITLIQEFIDSPDRSITRMEFVGGRFEYAARVDTTCGFELCPADGCSIAQPSPGTRLAFEVLPAFAHPLVERGERFLAAHGIEIAAIEFVTDGTGRAYVYDVNTNTNYNREAEQRAGVGGMDAIAAFLDCTLREAVTVDGAVAQVA